MDRIREETNLRKWLETWFRRNTTYEIDDSLINSDLYKRNFFDSNATTILNIGDLAKDLWQHLST